MGDGLSRDFFKEAKDEKAVLAQFVEMNSQSALKTKPKVPLPSNPCTKVVRKANANDGAGLRSRPQRYQAAAAEELHHPAEA